jgi:hypothetical protein
MPGSTTLLATSTKPEQDFRVKKLYMLFFASLLTLSCAAQPSPDISGDWEVKGVPHNLTKSRLWITMSSTGGMKAILYSPYEDVEPVLVTSAVFEDSSLTLSVEPLHMYYRGKLSADGSFIAGSLSRGRRSEMIDFHRAFDGQPVTVERLEQMLAAAAGKPGVQIAEQLYGLKLTERLSSGRLALDEANLSGPEVKLALAALSDRSAFLDLPATEILSVQKPDRAAQEEMLALITDYVNKTIHHLPNLFATRITTTYMRDRRFNTPLHAVGRYNVVVFYRDGHETQRHDAFQVEQGLTTRGEFGPILTAVMLDASKDNLIWSHWEAGAAGSVAVFRYAVDANHSHYLVEDRVSGYQGEIAIDPSNGTILRIVLRADMEPANPLLAADLVVEYGPEELGGKLYFCPKKGIALSQGLQLQRLNHVVFEEYHLFKASVRVLPGTKPVN